MIQKDYEYIRGSAVRQLDQDSTARELEQDSSAIQQQYDIYEENRVLREKKRYKSSRKVKLRMVMAIVSVLLAGLTIMWRYAIITKISYDINHRENEFAELKNENAILRVHIETMTNLTEVKDVAENKLGMQLPVKSQIVYVKIPRNDYTVMMKTQEETADDSSIFKAVLSKIQSLSRLFE